MALRAGDTFKAEHLWVILNDPEPPKNLIVAVNISTKCTDPECTLEPRKFKPHPDFNRTSYPRFDKTMCGPMAGIEKALAAGQVRRCPPLDPAAVAVIREAAIKSCCLRNPRDVLAVLEAE